MENPPNVLPANEENYDNTIKKKPTKKFTFKSFLYLLIGLILFASLIEIFAFFYFVFCGMAKLTINLFIYDWLSLFTKRSIHIFLSILANLSNFGLFFILSIFIIITAKILESATEYLIKRLKGYYNNSLTVVDEEKGEYDIQQKRKAFLVELKNFLIPFVLYSGFFVLFFFILFKWLFYVSVAYEVMILLIALSFFYRIFAKLNNRKRKDNDSLDENLTDVDNIINNYSNNISSDEENDNTNDSEEDNENENNLDSDGFDINTNNSGNKSNNNNNINDINNSNIDNNIDDPIFTLEVVNTLKDNINNIDIRNVIININSNIDIFNKKVSTINIVLDKTNEYINTTNNIIGQMNIISKKIETIDQKCKTIENYISNTKKINELYLISNLIAHNNKKIINDFIDDINHVMNTLKNIDFIINSPNNDEYIVDRMNFYIKSINSFIKKNLRKKIKIINHQIAKINRIISKEMKKDDENEENEEEDSEDNSFLLNNIMDKAPSCKGMFDNEIEPIKCLRNPVGYLVYKIIICLVLGGLQLYSVLYPYLRGFYSLGVFFGYLICKIFLIERICSYNIIDICVNWKKVTKTLKKKSHLILFYIDLALYGIAFIAFIISYIVVSKIKIFPTIDNAIYIENNQKWLKFDNISVHSEGFCSAKAQNDGLFKTEDFAMMATLPRLYGITKNGKCYLKPSKRGLFNSTMKYIFGKNFENDGIRIMCKMMAHNIYLVITSDKILNQTLNIFSSTKYTLLDNKFAIKNRDFFENFNFESLSEVGKFYYNIYKMCLLQNRTKCENEWDTFTQYYWSNMYSDDFVDIPGFESYQINIKSDMTIQPSFITEDGKLWSGTHYIVGGGYEDSWDFGFFIETIGLKFIPDLLENFLPLYSFIRDISLDTLNRIDWFNKYIFYTDDFTAKELTSIEHLLNQFNFSRQSLFAIGHSISGTVFKVISFSTDLQGIVFEAGDGETNMNYIHKSRLVKKSESDSLITNVYSGSSFTTGYDEKCNVNGILPNRYTFPSVYDTACLTAISCSNTMKYVPFCQQVLTQNQKDPLNEFNISFDAYLQYYGHA